MGVRWPLVLYLTDAAGVAGALFLASWAKEQMPFGQAVPEGTTFITPLLLVLLLGTWSFYGRVSRLYGPHGSGSVWVELRQVLAVLCLTTITLMGLVFLLKYHHVSRLFLVYFGALALAFAAGYRLALWWAWNWLRRLGFRARRLLIVGAGPLGQQVALGVQRERWANIRIVGFVDDRPSSGCCVLGSLRDTETMIRTHHVDEVLIALDSEHRGDLAALVHGLQWAPVRVKVVPDYLELAMARAVIQDVAGIPMLELRAPGIQGFDTLVKRALDVVGATVGLLIFWPLMLVIGLLVKADSPGPVLFRQTRIGENGRPFTLLKFRTMTVDAPSTPPIPSSQAELGKATFKVAPNDPRLTRVGRFLRRYSLDELPQLWNVLTGEMSLVGPRPEVPAVVRLYSPWHLKRLAIKPGVTGPMQVNGRGELPLDERVKLELAYIQKYSLWEDIKLLVKTLGAVVRPRGAY